MESQLFRDSLEHGSRIRSVRFEMGVITPMMVK
jgi:hypothetical protein